MKGSTYYTKPYTHSTLDQEATVIVAIQSIQKKRYNNEIYNKRIKGEKDK